ncbi:MAG: hypothetical protein MHPSP_002514 [Paramarteilia canceri]
MLKVLNPLRSVLWCKKIPNRNTHLVSGCFYSMSTWSVKSRRSFCTSTECQICSFGGCVMSSRHNFFKLFNIDEAHQIDENELQVSYRKMQQFFHPDRFFNSDTVNQYKIQEHSSLINEAYKTLKIPLSRAKHLYSVKCGNSYDKDSLQIKDISLFETMHKIDEEIQSIENDPSLLRKMQQELEVKIMLCERDFVDSLTDRKCKDAIAHLVKWNFFKNRWSKVFEMI